VYVATSSEVIDVTFEHGPVNRCFVLAQDWWDGSPVMRENETPFGWPIMISTD